jgi:hypothetical protein
MNDTVQFIAGAGIIGAAATFIFNGLLLQALVRSRERKGLLRMLRIDITNTQGNIETLASDLESASNYHFFVEASIPMWHRTTWDNHADRIAQLLRPELFEELAAYYGTLALAQYAHSLLLSQQQKRIEAPSAGTTAEDVARAYKNFKRSLQYLPQLSERALRVTETYI